MTQKPFSDLNLPAFLDRSTWSPERIARNNELWDARIAEQRERDAKAAQELSRKREIEKIERRLASMARRDIDPESVSAKIAASLETKLARLRGDGE